MLLGASVRKMVVTASLGIGFFGSTCVPNSAFARDGAVGAVGNAVGNAVGSVGNAVGNAVGSVGGAVQNAVGGVAGSTTPSGTVNSSNGTSSNAGVAGAPDQVAKVGNWIGAPYFLKKARRSESQDFCSSASVGSLTGQQCEDKAPDDMGNALGQASPNDIEPVVSRAETENPAPKSAQRPKLPLAQKPKLILARKYTEPKTGDAGNPKSLPVLSCDKAESIVGSYGFSGVKSSDCDGQVYSFDASRDGKLYSVTLNATNGELVSVRKLPAAAPPSQYE